MKRDAIILCSIICIKLILHFFLINPVYELQRDEYLHIDQGNHLAWGYLSVPPFTSWISWLIVHLKYPGFWVKFFPAVWGAGTIAAAWHITKATGGNLLAKSLTGIAILCSVILRINILYQPNSFEILSWTLVYLFLIKFILTDKTKWLYLLSIATALGFLNKYNILFPAASIFIALLLLPQRKIFLNRNLYLAAGFSFLLVLPNLIWQYNNHFPVIGHMKELVETQLVNVNPGDFIKNQFMFFAGSVFLIILSFIAFIKYKPFYMIRFIGLSYFICISLYLYFNAKDYYAIGLYPVLISTGSVYLEKISATVKRRWIRISAIVLILLLFIPLRLAFPVYTPENIIRHKEKYEMLGMLRWEDGKEHSIPQDFADMLGWKEMADKTLRLYNTFPDKKTAIVLCDNYGQAGAVNYYTTIRANSFNADYFNWFNIKTEITDIIYISEGTLPVNEYKGRPMFAQITLKDSITNTFSREKGSKIWLLRHNLQNINQIINERIAAAKR